MEEVFEIKVDDLIFDGIIEKDEDTINIFIGNTKMRMKSCIWIEFTENNPICVLQNLEYLSKCELNNKLQSGIGTIKMAKTALKFVFDKYPYLKYIEIYDKSKKNRINITPKRLLLGKEGWYREHFGAIPNNERTIRIIKRLNKINFDKKIIEKREWGTDEDLFKLLNDFDIKGTLWKIDRDIILNYSINYEIIQKGGNKNIKNILKITNKNKQDHTFLSLYDWKNN